MKKYIVATLLLAVSFTFSYAETLTDDVVEQIDCARITSALKLGSRDKNTNGDVTTLQIYLSQAGYLDSDPTGYFGNATKKAVQSFQNANGLSPIGSVGPATRAKIKAVSCTSTNSDGISTVDKPIKEKEIAYTCPNGKTIYVPNNDEKRKYVEKYCGTSSEDRPVACTMEYRSCADGSAMPRDTSNCKWLENKCPSVKPVTGDVNVLKLYVSGSDDAFMVKENVSKDIAKRYCEEKALSYSGKALRCTWAGDEIYASKAISSEESSISETVKCVFGGSSGTEQKCYGYSIATTAGQDVRYFSCGGVGSCSTTVKGMKGATIKWSASCGESTSTVIDGTDKYATFTCTR